MLDVGAGPCLLEPFAPTPYIAIDGDEAALGPCPRRLVASVTALPFRTSSAGTTTCVSVLQYVVDAEAAVRELHRVTAPGGVVIVLVPNLSYARNLAKLAGGRFPWSSVDDDWHGGTLRYFTRRDLLPMLQRSGFSIRRVRCSGRAADPSVSRPHPPHREGGCVETVLERDEIRTELIADGRHLPPELLRLTVKAKGVDRVCLITDAMRGAGMPDGFYTFGPKHGQKTQVKNGEALMLDLSSFASSVVTMDVMVRNAVNLMDLTRREASPWPHQSRTRKVADASS